VIRRAFDLGITHFDLANNYGPHYGTAERNFGTILREDLRGKYLDGAKPTGSRADSLLPEHLTEDNRSRIRSLADIAIGGARVWPSWPWPGRYVTNG